MEDAKFAYVHHPSESVDVHHISLKTRPSLLLRVAALFLLAISLHLLLAKDLSVASCLWSFPLAAVLIKILLSRSVQKESVLIIPDFGIQLETYYGRKVVRRFVPIGKILQPILNECVTPMTCYWSLSMIVRGEEGLLLVFKELQPPVKMLVPIWKALRAAINNAENHLISG
uniref:Phosphatidylinositol N-acetylglucosaminyltransferase subunit H conserved domain-containing protein n=1 Tax=Kalanchoe fedtschenkoi TaxID=63787 RepID=A0A7N0URL5_KALFE